MLETRRKHTARIANYKRKMSELEEEMEKPIVRDDSDFDEDDDEGIDHDDAKSKRKKMKKSKKKSPFITSAENRDSENYIHYHSSDKTTEDG